MPRARYHVLTEQVQLRIGAGTPFDCEVKGFGFSWNNGRFLSALVESYFPGSLKDWAIVYGNAVENLDKCERALAAAAAVGVPEVLAAQHLASPECDELSLVTYLSGFQKQVREALEGLGGGEKRRERGERGGEGGGGMICVEKYGDGDVKTTTHHAHCQMIGRA